MNVTELDPGRRTTDRSARGVKEAGYMYYDAFISYSHAADGRLAPAILRALQRFAAPFPGWWAVAVPRRNEPLGELRPLADNRARARGVQWFVLLASPEAAASPWVARELAWWLEHRSAERLLTVLTYGELAWSERGRDFDWSKTTSL